MDRVPSLILEHMKGGQIFLGGYKAALNTSFLKNKNITLVVDTAKGLGNVLGPKYSKMVSKGRVKKKQFPNHFGALSLTLEVVKCLFVDSKDLSVHEWKKFGIMK